MLYILISLAILSLIFLFTMLVYGLNNFKSLSEKEKQSDRILRMLNKNKNS